MTGDVSFVLDALRALRDVEASSSVRKVSETVGDIISRCPEAPADWRPQSAADTELIAFGRQFFSDW